MIDLKLDNRGDFVLNEQKKLPRLRIQFHCSKWPVLRIRFMQGQQHAPKEKAEDVLQVQFRTEDHTGLLDETSIVPAVTETDELKQEVMMKMRTEFGETDFDDTIGSTLTMIKHRDLMDETVIEEIKGRIENDLAGLVDDMSVTITHEQYDGPFYSQNLTLRIYSGHHLVYQTEI